MGCPRAKQSQIPSLNVLELPYLLHLPRAAFLFLCVSKINNGENLDKLLVLSETISQGLFPSVNGDSVLSGFL